ncbi:MAG: PfkB family carbohydrate kinase [bacterium]|nr:PfkB family carbohydrate kinase [bacterium]
MNIPKEELLSALDKISGISVLVVGDLILDRYIWGAVDRISPEAPVPIVNVMRTEDRSGGAGNVVNNLVNLGVRVQISGFIGDDTEGKILSSIFDSQKVNREGIIKLESRPTSLKTRVIAQRQQIVRIDREQTSSPGNALCEGLAAVVTAQLDSVNAVIVSDYGKGSISEPVLMKLSNARKNGILNISKKPLVLDPHPKNYSIYNGFSVVKPNRKEAEAASGITISNEVTAIKAADIIRKKWNVDLVIITMGEDGLLLSPASGKSVLLETEALEVFDVSGAGDTVTAVYTAAVASGSSTEIAGHLANLAAGVVVAEVGTVPITLEGLKNHIVKVYKLEN